MTLNELLDTFIGSSRDDWNRIACWGHGSGPSYRNQFTFWEVFNGNENVITHREHSDVASYKADLSITIAWGIDVGSADDRVDRPWARNNPDDNPGVSHYLDFFYNDALVFRTSYCVVDGGRCPIPFPNYDNNGNVFVSRRYHDLIKTFADIAFGLTDTYDVYFDRTEIELTNENWPN